jgi:radical SAM superfamily enzyme YgiQ (UPF0313 family)
MEKTKEKNRIKKIIIVLPNALWSGTRKFNVHPYSACLLGAVLKGKYQVKILDANLDDLSLEESADKVIEYSPDVVGISGMSIEYAQSCHQLAALIKKKRPESMIIMGGAYPTLLPEVAIKDINIDFLILSEGEFRFPRLLEAIENNADYGSMEGTAYRKDGKPVINMHTEYISDLDSVPLPDYSLVNFKEYTNKHNKYSLYNDPRYLPYAVTISSRGCPFNCVFCSSKNLHGRRCRMRSAENVLEEIDHLVKDYGVKEIIFLDDNLLLDRKRTEKILNGIIDRKYDLHWKATNVPTFSLDEDLLKLMKKSGCYQITLPIESGNAYVLKNIIHKPLDLDKAIEVIKIAKKLDFEIACLFVIGLPGETWDQILDTVNFAEKIDVDWVVFSIATPLPKTELYDIAKERGYLEPGFNFSEFKFFGYGHGSITTEEFTPRELEMLRAIEWDRINFKTEEKKKKIALMNSITMKELHDWRVSTRRNVGGYVKYDNSKDDPKESKKEKRKD